MNAPSRLAAAAYGLPAIALAALYLPLFTYVAPFYIEERGVDIQAMGLALIGIRLFDAAINPGIGWLSDRTRVRSGRRRVWLVGTTPLICLATWMAFVPPPAAGLNHAVIWLFVLGLAWTMVQTPYNAWGAEITDDPTGRVQVTAWREGLALVGTVATTLAYFLGGTGGGGLAAVAAMVVVLLPLGVLAAVWLAPERAPRPRQRVTIAQGARAMARNAGFRRLLLAWFINGAANALPATLFLFFVAQRIQAPEAVGWLLLVYFAAAILGLPFWSWAAGRFGKHRTWGAAMIYNCAVFAPALALGAGDLTGFAVVAVLSGLALGADLSLPPAIQADVIEQDTADTGAERAGVFFAVWQLATTSALALSSGLALIALGAAGFDGAADPGGNAPPALLALSLLYAGAPIVLKLAAVALMWNFTLGAPQPAPTRP